MIQDDDLLMDEQELSWWGRVRMKGALWYIVSKGLVFLGAYPTLGCYVMSWEWDPRLLVEGWMIGLFWGAFIYLRKELRFRFTLENAGLPIPDVADE